MSVWLVLLLLFYGDVMPERIFCFFRNIFPVCFHHSGSRNTAIKL